MRKIVLLILFVFFSSLVLAQIDSDQDTIPDDQDNCPTIPNKDQAEPMKGKLTIPDKSRSLHPMASNELRILAELESRRPVRLEVEGPPDAAHR